MRACRCTASLFLQHLQQPWWYNMPRALHQMLRYAVASCMCLLLSWNLNRLNLFSCVYWTLHLYLLCKHCIQLNITGPGTEDCDVQKIPAELPCRVPPGFLRWLVARSLCLRAVRLLRLWCVPNCSFIHHGVSYFAVYQCNGLCSPELIPILKLACCLCTWIMMHHNILLLFITLSWQSATVICRYLPGLYPAWLSEHSQVPSPTVMAAGCFASSTLSHTSSHAWRNFTTTSTPCFWVDSWVGCPRRYCSPYLKLGWSASTSHKVLSDFYPELSNAIIAILHGIMTIIGRHLLQRGCVVDNRERSTGW